MDPEDLKLWSVEDANATLPRVRAALPRLRAAIEEQREGVEEASALARDTQDGVRSPAHALHADYARALDRARHGKAVADAVVAELAAIGVEVKDPILGLVDFPALRGSEVVYLCWREGEPEITQWHPLHGGFAGRRPLDALVRAGGR